MEKKISFVYEPGEPGEGYLVFDPNTKSSSQVRVAEDGVSGLELFKGELILDLSSEGKIVGIEILGDIIPSNLK